MAGLQGPMDDVYLSPFMVGKKQVTASFFWHFLSSDTTVLGKSVVRTDYCVFPVLPDLIGDAATNAEPEREAVHRWVENEAPHQIERWEGLCRGK